MYSSTTEAIIDMFSGTGELARAVSTGLEEPTRTVSFSDNYGPASCSNADSPPSTTREELSDGFHSEARQTRSA